jgi:alkylhydroperoxidase/carboxymuconolactone decarboxylase family protein YurZ
MSIMTAIGASNSAISRESVRICEVPYVCGAAGQRRRPSADREAADRKTERSQAMAKGDAPVLEALADINTVSLERTELDPASLILVRLAALIASDAPASSYLFHLGPAAAAGVTLDQAQDTLVAVAPIVGTPRTAAAAAKIVEALGLAIDLSQPDQDT